MEARFANEEEAAIVQPGKHAASEWFDLVVAQVHQKPIGEDDVELLVGRKIELRHIGAHEVHVTVMTVALTILLHVIGHEIHCCQLFCMLCQIIGEPPDK